MIVATIGGVTVGLWIFIRHAIAWWPEGGVKALKSQGPALLADWLPFLFGWAYGALGILTSMGLIGWAFDGALWASNWLGDAAIWVGVGEAPMRTAAGAPIQLTGLGDCMVLLLTGAVLALLKKSKMGPAVKKGTWCGLCLGTASGISGSVAGPLALGVNWLGATVYGAVA